MPRSLRHRWLLVYAGIFALIGQLMLPTVHAQNLAQRSGNPLFAAFCGEVAPQRLAALQQQLQASLQRGDQASQPPHLLQAACSVCVSLHALQLAPPLASVMPVVLSTAPYALLEPVLAQIVRPLVQLPPLRGPPRIS